MNRLWYHISNLKSRWIRFWGIALAISTTFLGNTLNGCFVPSTKMKTYHRQRQTHAHTHKQIKQRKKNTMKKKWWKSVRPKIRIFQTKTTNEMTLQRTALDLLVETIHLQIWWPFSAAASFTWMLYAFVNGGTGVFHLYQPSSINFSLWRWRCARLVLIPMTEPGQ